MVYSSTTIELGAARRPFYFRQQSSDPAVIKDILVDQHYNLNRLSRCAELLAFAKEQQAIGLRPLVVDAGANIGASAIYFIGNMPNALVVAIEPAADNFALLTKNVEGLDVEAICGAVSSTSGRVRVVESTQGHWAYRTVPTSEGVDASPTVPCVTINEISELHRSKYFPFIVKIDIEGAEKDLFSNNTEWIALTPIIVIELHDWLFPKAGTSRPFLQCISKFDRDFVYVGEDIFSITNELPVLTGRSPLISSKSAQRT
jgi:FkbM family methyltransferase